MRIEFLSLGPVKNSKFQNNAILSDFFWSIVPRGLALFLGGFGLLNVAGGILHTGFDANLWWLDLRRLAPALAAVLVLTASFGLIVFGLRPPRSGWGRMVTALSVIAPFGIALGNSFSFYILLGRGHIGSRLPLPFSLLIAGSLALILVALRKAPRLPVNRAGFLPALGVCLACCIVFPLGQMFCFGKTDYRRGADVAVVFGARVYRDGRPSDALADRVRTACKLYNAGLTRKLLFSGGPGDGLIHETEAMKQMAIRLGVNPEDILLDKKGMNTRATVKNTKEVFPEIGASRVLVVSHFYHLPRIKLAYQREGLDVYTVPAKETYLLGQLPYNMAREVAALWVYYLRPLAEAPSPS